MEEFEEFEEMGFMWRLPKGTRERVAEQIRVKQPPKPAVNSQKEPE